MSLVIHIGIPKSGTTFLQNQILNGVQGLRCIGRPHQERESYRRFHHAAMYEEDERKAKVELAAFFESEIGSRANEPFVLSEEALCFAPLWHVVARRLAQAVPEARILITLRNQFTAVTSWYANHGRLLRSVPEPYRGRHVTFDDWFHFAEKNIDVPYLKNYLRVLHFDRLADIFAGEFGEKNIHILLYESMIEREGSFEGDLSRVLGVDCRAAFRESRDRQTNPRSSGMSVSYNALRSRVPFLGKLVRSLPGGPAITGKLREFMAKGDTLEVALSERQRETLYSIYAGSNRRVAARFGLPLEAYGYPV